MTVKAGFIQGGSATTGRRKLAMTGSDHMEQIQQNDDRDRDTNSPE
jgi:hypothetical protein